MRLIEGHIIQSFPVNCLNRDDLGAPKSAIFGGVERARNSSQCWKRPKRQLTKEMQPDLFSGLRTRYIIPKLESILINKSIPAEDAKKLSVAIAEELGKSDSKSKERVKTLLYFSPNELENIAESISKTDIKSKNLEKNIEKAIKDLKNPVKDAADIALFGRMVANDHSLKIEGAAMFNHPISTHRVNNEIDFFTAVDDLKPEETEGAGHIGTLEYNSACYYRYFGLNLDMLRDDNHLGHFSKEELKTVIETFIKASIMAVPGGRKNSMMAYSLPSYVMILLRNGQPLTLANAFEKPIKSNNGYIKPSIDEMNKHFEEVYRAFNLKVPELNLSIPEKDLDTVCKELTETALNKIKEDK